ncbi:6,7-dimethyl-8-ribityllumazine synthase [Candidatus Aminicenantes bacterium AC-708-M15]|jgi:6,7-dimethyl-8-ribityllumazine synthase|nr:6,7-dimethyl-8-ribityllumazine synthase [SCandidatus Aminicenantes bacterium Aminicenantia_JdfR_composite]MCP2596461.1 6,7-dimethyl-8-ribityllumazine synthase [Candidatus Aminicenantes bacterium AC-335-G13]MCP2598153.1 6,7-dimethyl-8-ribityllumazine synthase [Candidatus Aminicenantes bacterium AC-335-L06]MCP2598913.1 6,7-dimethyl-8-ribityllumazine synthase [Candidatus Aminicenantes bacterium AC-335-B20]MCP2603857.1 6,7-dimethyl-8-ribityllumazine synthase [Candidatus Aminicenantes bacterium A
MKKIYEGKLNAKGLKIGIIVSRFNQFITDKLLEGALDALNKLGAEEENISIFKVPGSFEIPVVLKHLVESNKFDGVICLGTLIRGDTPHFDFLSAEVTKGLAQISIESGVPVAYGILTVDTIEQGIERAGTKSGNKGWDAALSVVEMINLLKETGFKH